MPRRPMTAKDLWDLPRVGAPAPSPDGKWIVVPVTTHAEDSEKAITRLWLVRAGAAGEEARPLTGAATSSSSPSWSPDGSRIAFLRKPGGEKGAKGGPAHPDANQVHVISVGGGEAERVTDLPLGATDPRWLPGGGTLVFVADLFAVAPTPADTATRAEKPDAKQPRVHATEDRYYRHWDRWITDGRVQHIFALDLGSGELLDLTPTLEHRIDPPGGAGRYDISPDGGEIAFCAVRSAPPHDPLMWGTFTLRVPKRIRAGARTYKPKDITPAAYPASEVPHYSPDGRWIVFCAYEDPYTWAGHARLFAHDRNSGVTTRIATMWELDPGEIAFAAGRSAKLLLTTDVEGRTGVFELPLARAVRTPRTAPREILRGGSFTGMAVAGRRVFATRAAIAEPPEIVSFAADGTDERRESRFTASVMNHLRMGAVEEVVFAGAGGDPVQMFLVQPVGVKRAARKNLPLVHLIHGGPHGVFGDTWHWRWNAQVFSGAGYVAAMVNFHGSKGWGEQFTRSIEGTWGDQPYDDVMCATDHLIASGLVDPKRMAATGGSYGGYMASWIASQTDRFACIVNHAGVCDLMHQWGADIPQGWAVTAGGDPWSNLEGLDRYSPMRHARGFKSPMLVLHGELDYRVPYYQALEIYNVHKAMGVPARLVVYQDENHWILKRGNSLHWYGEFLGWLDRWLGGGARA